MQSMSNDPYSRQKKTNSTRIAYTSASVYVYACASDFTRFAWTTHKCPSNTCVARMDTARNQKMDSNRLQSQRNPREFRIAEIMTSKNPPRQPLRDVPSFVINAAAKLACKR